jgi:hypothetical protein
MATKISVKRRAMRNRKTDWHHLTHHQIRAWYMTVDQIRHGTQLEVVRHGRQIPLKELSVIYMPQMVDV